MTRWAGAGSSLHTRKVPAWRARQRAGGCAPGRQGPEGTQGRGANLTLLQKNRVFKNKVALPPHPQIALLSSLVWESSKSLILMVNKGKKRGSDPPPAHSKCSASVAGHTGVGENVIWDSQGHGSPSGSPREPASPKTPGAVIRPRRQELGSRGALRAPRREHRWAAAPGQSLGPRALAGAGGDSRSPPRPSRPRCTGTRSRVRGQVGLPHIAHRLESAGCLPCPWSPGN